MGGGGVGGGEREGRIDQLRSLEKILPKYAIFSTVLSKIVAKTNPESGALTAFDGLI